MKYYAFIAGLPDLIFEEHRKVYTIKEFKEELMKLLSWGDKRVIKKLFLVHDNQNLLSYLKYGENAVFNEMGNYSQEEIHAMVEVLKDEDLKWNRKYPRYLEVFISEYLETEGEPKIFWEDRLSGLYYRFLCKTQNSFLREWSELNMNIRNILTMFSCRRANLEYKSLIVGENAVAGTIRATQNPEHAIMEQIDYLESIREIEEEKDLMEKEQRVDLLLWEWLEENTFFHYFDIEKIMSYLFKLQILERWRLLDKEQGEKIFREIVNRMKKSVDRVGEILK